ncbi:uncharacterized protein C8R40DRAFT_1073342 [Lentinula edodes]|uniref:uncharacterized protein n=1 Tax=Lentinula edodes TaxID=5353 RepID=UPI001E8E5FD2|nr:uncharacterized protein C8R40DRAFT_1073342 [Lentinula edodes]KAH7870268.1 hypothetical protein C8R40DRAFT_1073342 [Lentinula edodes]
MLPRIVASPLFVLLCFWVCMLAVLALPMPTGDSKDTVPVSEHHPPTVLDLELNIIFCNMDTLDEHSMIKIGDTILHATTSDTSVPRREVTLKPEQYVFRRKPSKRFFPTQPIGKARFRDEQDVRDAVGEMIEGLYLDCAAEVEGPREYCRWIGAGNIQKNLQ